MGLLDTLRRDPTVRTALAWGLLAGFLTAAYTLSLPNRYRSETLVLPKSAAVGGPLAGLSAMTGILGGSLAKIDDQAYYADIVESRWMAEKVLDAEYAFTYRSWYFGSLQTRKQTLAAFLEADTPKRRESALREVLRWLNALLDFKSGVMIISAEAPSPELAQQMVNRAVDLLDLALKTRIQTQGLRKAEYARDRLAKARLEEAQVRQALVAFAESHRNFTQSPDPGIRSRGEELSADLVLRRQVTTSLALGYEQVELDAQNTVPVLSRLDEAYLPREKTRPPRGGMVLLALIFVGAGRWFWLNRERVQARLQAGEPSSS
jgi:uncharacterized protein involved in exopolysaccharide biosynthesis